MIKKIFYFIGKRYESKNNWKESIHWYHKSYSKNNAIVNYRLGFCYEKQKDYQNAIDFFKKAIALQNNKPHWHRHLASSFMALNGNTATLPPENIFIENIQESEANTFLYTITGTLIKRLNKNEVSLYIQTRIDTIESSPPPLCNFISTY